MFVVVVVSLARVRIALAGSLRDVWSCPPLLKWVVLQAAKQGDAELLGAVLGKGQQKENQPQQSQQQQQQQDQESQEDTKQQQQQQQQEQQQEQKQKQNQVPDELEGVNSLLNLALGAHAGLFKELGYPRPHFLPTKMIWRGDGLIWLAGLAAEAAVCAGHLQLLKQMVQNGCFPRPQADEDTVVKQHLTPSLKAAAAAGDVEAAKVLLSYCPGLLDYALQPVRRPTGNFEGMCLDAVLSASDLALSQIACMPCSFELVPLLGLLHKDGFTGMKVQNGTKGKLLLDLCRHNQSQQAEFVQVLLDVGIVSCDERVFYYTNKDFKPRGYFEKDGCPIVAVAVAEQNAGAVAVLVAAGAVLPAPTPAQSILFDYNSLQSVLQELELAAEAAAAGGVNADKYQAAAGVLRAYCEEHGKESIEASAVARKVLVL